MLYMLRYLNMKYGTQFNILKEIDRCKLLLMEEHQNKTFASSFFIDAYKNKTEHRSFYPVLSPLCMIERFA